MTSNVPSNNAGDKIITEKSEMESSSKSFVTSTPNITQNNGRDLSIHTQDWLQEYAEEIIVRSGIQSGVNSTRSKKSVNKNFPIEEKEDLITQFMANQSHLKMEGGQRDLLAQYIKLK